MHNLSFDINLLITPILFLDKIDRKEIVAYDITKSETGKYFENWLRYSENFLVLFTEYKELEMFSIEMFKHIEIIISSDLQITAI